MSVHCQDEFDENSKTIRTAKENSGGGRPALLPRGGPRDRRREHHVHRRSRKGDVLSAFRKQGCPRARVPRKPRSSSVGLSLSARSPKGSASGSDQIRRNGELARNNRLPVPSYRIRIPR